MFLVFLFLKITYLTNPTMVELNDLPDNSVPENHCAFQEITTYTAGQTGVMTNVISNFKKVIDPENSIMLCSPTSVRTISQFFIMPPAL